ncbi:iron chaperone [Cellulosimicrobium marinum]|uniref:iron chaperone n=1 Tax=Cellulosimicrobium marinum TaxID=1638992 RepID=UPI001E40FC1A|nr:DUF1801 domain-containing protein [Cellulosimicrobium marinum]MCB7137977.1 hypothetical protein [Cellulosimicrobium marinum]
MTRTTTEEGYGGFTAEERAAMKERAKELKATTDGEQAVLAKIAEMPDADREIAERVHAIVSAEAPHLVPRTWYGQPAWALPGKGSRPGPIVCFFQAAAKFGTRYATLGFNDDARLDDGTMWPTAYALTGIGDENEQRIARLVRTAAG